MKPVYVHSWIVMLLLCVLSQSAAIAQSHNSPSDESFSMEVADRFRIVGGGVVITGVIASGTVSVGDSVCLVSESAGQRELEVTGIEMFRKVLESASAGDRVGLLVIGANLEEISIGDRLAGSCP